MKSSEEMTKRVLLRLEQKKRKPAEGGNPAADHGLLPEPADRLAAAVAPSGRIRFLLCLCGKPEGAFR